jgi:hypothetical protein
MLNLIEEKSSARCAREAGVADKVINPLQRACNSGSRTDGEQIMLRQTASVITHWLSAVWDSRTAHAIAAVFIRYALPAEMSEFSSFSKTNAGHYSTHNLILLTTYYRDGANFVGDVDA